MNEINSKLEEIAAGDRIVFVDSTLSGVTRTIPATAIEIRHILGKQTHVVEPELGKRKVVGVSQVSKIEFSK